MQFLSISRRRIEQFSEDMFNEQLEAERERIRELYRDGIVRTLWSRKDTPGAVMLLECAGESEAWAALNSLPLAQRGMLEVQLVPLASYPAFFPRGG